MFLYKVVYEKEGVVEEVESIDETYKAIPENYEDIKKGSNTEPFYSLIGPCIRSFFVVYSMWICAKKEAIFICIN